MAKTTPTDLGVSGGTGARRVLTVGNMYPPLHLGGYELMWESSTRHLRGLGMDVRVLTTDYEASSAPAGQAGIFRELRWYWHHHAFPRLSPGARLDLERHNLSILRRHLEAFRPDVVAWWAMGGMSMSLLEEVRSQNTPAVGVVVDDWMVYGPKVDAWQRLASRLGPLRGWLGEWTGVPTRVDIEAAARWLFVSEAVLRHARAEGISPRDPVIAHAGIESALFDPAPPKSRWAGRLLCLGRIDRRKGIANAIRALAELPEETLDIVGSGDDEHLAELEALVRSLGLASRVEFRTLPRGEIADAYRAADSLLFPVTWEEPWGLVPLEAMACGTPVIATGSGGSGEYLAHGENCLIFEPKDDPLALAGAVRALKADSNLRERIRANGLETAHRFPAAQFNESVASLIEDPP